MTSLLYDRDSVCGAGDGSAGKIFDGDNFEARHLFELARVVVGRQNNGIFKHIGQML